LVRALLFTPHVYQRDIAQIKTLSIGTLKSITLGKKMTQNRNIREFFPKPLPPAS